MDMSAVDPYASCSPAASQPEGARVVVASLPLGGVCDGGADLAAKRWGTYVEEEMQGQRVAWLESTQGSGGKWNSYEREPPWHGFS
jgi:hypothetical protein